MKNYQVLFAPEAEEQLLTLYRFIVEAASAVTAQTYTEGIISYCESLSLFPERGNLRDDLLPGLRVINWRKRTVIAFVVENNQVKSWASGMAVSNTKPNLSRSKVSLKNPLS